MIVEFVVRVPDVTPDWLPVCLAGDGPALRQWSADGFALERWDDGTRRARVPFEAGSRVRYLVTLGRWRTVECGEDGRERPPRELTAGSPTTIEVHVAGWGRDSVRYHHDFPSEHLAHPRSLIVHRPPGYDLEPDRRYPVFYLQDGQNLFDDDTAFGGHAWHCDETAERLARTGEVPPVILVGIGNTPDRLREYGAKRTGRGDRSRAFGRFLVREAKPFIDATYRTLPGREHTAVGGSSMGGLIALNLCKWYPGVFGMCGAMSPSLWWDGESFLRDIGSKAGWLTTCKVWLDMGGREGNTRATQRAGLQRARRLAESLRGFGLETAGRLRFVEDPIGGHDERAWAARFGDVLRFLFNPA